MHISPINGNGRVCFHYRFFQTSIVSNLPLTGLLKLNSQPSAAGINFIVQDDPIVSASETFKWYHQYFRHSNGDAWLSCARHAGGYLVREKTVGDFFVTGDGSAIFCHPLAGISPAEIQETFFYPILPLAFNLRGVDGLHAAAVKLDKGAVAFAGPSGLGKSTLAAYFKNLGYPLLTDEFLAISTYEDALTVLPGLPEVRLWEPSLAFFESQNAPLRTDVFSSKMIVDLEEGTGSFLADRVPLKRIYFLERSDQVGAEPALKIETLTGQQAFLKMIDQSYRLDVHDRKMLHRQTDLFARIISAGHVKLLKLDWGFELLPKAAELILSDCQEN